MKRLMRFRMLPWKAKKAILLRYALFQTPDTVIFIIVLVILNRFINISSELFWGLIALWLVKDAVTFPLLWRAYAGTISESRYSLIDAEGIVTEKCDPRGFVLVRGELWQAEAEEGTCLNKGEYVVVTGSRGLILLIKPKKS